MPKHDDRDDSQDRTGPGQPLTCSLCDTVLYIADPAQVKTDDEGRPLCEQCYGLRDDPDRDSMLLGG